MKNFLLLISALTVLAAPPAFATADAENGKVIYEKLCWWCHGRKGEGDGPAAAYLNPPPRDFTMGSYKWKTTPHDEIMPSDADYHAMIAGMNKSGWDGLGGTSMPGWGDRLDDSQMRDVAEHIKSMAGMEEPKAPSIVFGTGSGPTAGVLAQGKRLYESRCAECHGEAGRGDGEKGLKDDWGARTWPRNLTKGWTFRAGSDAAAIYARVTVGIPGTQMPSFADPASTKALNDDERRAVAYYAASLDAPYKKPSADTVVKAVRTEGELPGPRDAGWEKAAFSSLYLFPQIVAGERLFAPSLDSVSVKALYNDSDIAVYVEWDDPTMSVPGDEKAEEIAGSVVYPDMVAVQFPAGFEKGGHAPYFGMGGAAGEVNIWTWQVGQAGNAGQGAGLMSARGINKIVKKDAAASGLKAQGYYERGTWRVVFTRPLDAPGINDISFKEGVFTPVALAAWDGSNNEKGSRHSMTGWATVRLEPRPKASLYIWPVIIAIIFLGAEMLWARSARKAIRGE